MNSVIFFKCFCQVANCVIMKHYATNHKSGFAVKWYVLYGIAWYKISTKTYREPRQRNSPYWIHNS